VGLVIQIQGRRLSDWLAELVQTQQDPIGVTAAVSQGLTDGLFHQVSRVVLM